MHTKSFILVFITLMLVGVGIGYIVSHTNPEVPASEDMPQGSGVMSPRETTIESVTFTDTALGIEFQYPNGTDGFHFARIDGNSSLPTFITLLQLTDMDDYTELMRSTEGREGPPTIDIRIFKNIDRLSPSVWALRNPLVSNVGLKIGEESETVVGGANAITYTNDGLYTTKNVVIAHGGLIYLVSAGFIDENSLTLTAFEDVLNSIRFIPTDAKG